MKKLNQRMKFYGIVWLIAFVIFNVIAFIVPSANPAISKFTASFWIGYVAITLAFVGQLVCVMVALKEENNQKLFYNISLVSISYTGLIIMLVAGALCMAIPGLPYWVGIVISVLALGFTAIAVVQASTAIEEVERIDQKVKEQTFFIKSLTIDADAVIASVKTAEIKEQAKKVYEAIRYADPMSNPALNAVESQIADKFNEFASIAKTEDTEKTKSVAEELLLLIRNRNQKCKLLK